MNSMLEAHSQNLAHVRILKQKLYDTYKAWAKIKTLGIWIFRKKTSVL